MIHFTQQTDGHGNSTGGVLSVTLFLMAINSILGELENAVNRSLFADDLATRNQRMTIRELQGVTNKLYAWTVERGLAFSISKIISMIFRKKNKKANLTLQGNYPVPRDDPRQQTELGGAYWQSKNESRESNKHFQSSSRKNVGRRQTKPKKGRTCGYN